MAKTKISAFNWLHAYLADGELHLVDNVKDAYKAAGFTRAEMKVARKSLGVKAFHQFDESGATSNYFWYIEE